MPQQTPENSQSEERVDIDQTVQGELEYASLGERFFGHVIDNILIVGLLAPIVILPNTLVGAYMGLWFLFVLFYIFILEGLWTNQTVGKYAMNMKVAKDNGSQATIFNSLVRNAIGIIGNFFGIFGLLVGAFAIHQSEENQRLGDNLAGTVIIKTTE